MVLKICGIEASKFEEMNKVIGMKQTAKNKATTKNITVKSIYGHLNAK